MEKEKMSEEDSNYMSWDEFKEEYLSKVEFLAQVLGIDRNEAVETFEKHFGIFIQEEDDIDEDYKFVSGVIKYVASCKCKEQREGILSQLKTAKGAERIFNEVYRMWSEGGDIRNYGNWVLKEHDKGYVVDSFQIKADGPHGATFLIHSVEQYSGFYDFPLEVTARHSPYLTDEELVKCLRDLADAVEANFQNCYLPNDIGYIVPRTRKGQAIVYGLKEDSIYSDVCFGDFEFLFDFHEGCRHMYQAVRSAGWVRPDVSMNSGLGKVLSRGWPELFRRVCYRELTPFEALCKTGMVHPDDVCNALTNDAGTQGDVQNQSDGDPRHVQVGQVDDSDEQLLLDLEGL